MPVGVELFGFVRIKLVVVRVLVMDLVVIVVGVGLNKIFPCFNHGEQSFIRQDTHVESWVIWCGVGRGSKY